MIYSHEVEQMCTVAQGVNHGAAPIPEEAKWVKAKDVTDISGLTHGIGWCAPQQGGCKLTLNVKNKTTNYLKNFVKFFNVFVGLCDKNNFFVKLFFFCVKNLEFSFFLVNSMNYLNSISLVVLRILGYNFVCILL
jgi:hypothetical protein